MFEVVDEEECHDNGCNPLPLKRVDKVKDEMCRATMVCRRDPTDPLSATQRRLRCGDTRRKQLEIELDKEDLRAKRRDNFGS